MEVQSHKFMTIHGRKCCISYDSEADTTKGVDIEDHDNKMFMMQPGYVDYDQEHGKNIIEYAHRIFVVTALTHIQQLVGFVQQGYQDN